MRTRRIVWVAVTVTVVGYLLFCVIGGVFVAENTLHPKRRILTEEQEKSAPAWAREDDATLTQISISARDGISLRGWTVRPEESNGNAVILLHGLADNRMAMEDYADFLLLHGYTVLMPDARAHGESGGAIATFGALESNDIHLWFEWLRANEHPKCIFGFGESMGAAQLLESLSAEPDFCAVAAEGSFSSFREISYERAAHPFHTGPWLGRILFRPLIDSAFLYARWRYGVDFDHVSPITAVAGSRVPVLLIHGQIDKTIDIRHSRLIAAQSARVVLWELPNTGHSNAIDTEPHDLELRLVAWFHGQSNQSSIAAIKTQGN